MSTLPTDPAAILAALAAPFDADEVEFLPGAVSGARALAMPYVDARVVQDRLDAVMGIDGWADNYEVLADSSVICRLRLRFGELWIEKCDVAGPSDQKDGGDRMKAAFSGALKRAAVKFAVGRYLYSLPAQWCDFDPQAKRFKTKPKLPAKALPAPNGQQSKPVVQQPKPAAPIETPVPAARPTALATNGTKEPPAPGRPLADWLRLADDKAQATGKAKKGELIRHVVASIAKGTQLGNDPATWPADRVPSAVAAARGFFQLITMSASNGAAAVQQKGGGLPAVAPLSDGAELANAAQLMDLAGLAQRAGIAMPDVLAHVGLGERQGERDLSVSQWRTATDWLTGLADAVHDARVRR